MPSKNYPSSWKRIRQRIISQHKQKYSGKSRCFFCFRECTNEETVDHLIPICLSKNHSDDNMVISCIQCNNDKSKVTGAFFSLQNLHTKRDKGKLLTKRQRIKSEKSLIKILGANFIEV